MGRESVGEIVIYGGRTIYPDDMVFVIPYRQKSEGLEKPNIQALYGHIASLRKKLGGRKGPFEVSEIFSEDGEYFLFIIVQGIGRIKVDPNDFM